MRPALRKAESRCHLHSCLLFSQSACISVKGLFPLFCPFKGDFGLLAGGTEACLMAGFSKSMRKMISHFSVWLEEGVETALLLVFLAEFKVWKQKSSQYLNIFHLESSLQDFCFSIYMLKWHGDTRFEERILCLSLSIGFNPLTGNLTVLSESCYQMQYSFLKRI